MTYRCFHCGEETVGWDNDFSFEDYGIEGEGIIHVCHCGNCGAEIEYRVEEDRNSDYKFMYNKLIEEYNELLEENVDLREKLLSKKHVEEQLDAALKELDQLQEVNEEHRKLNGLLRGELNDKSRE